MTITARELRGRGWEAAMAGGSGGEFLRRAAASGLPTVGWPFRWVIDPVTVWSARRYLHRERPDLIVVALGCDIRTMGLAACRMEIPIVWRVGVPFPRLGWLHRLTGKTSVSRVIVPSQYMRLHLERFDWLAGKVDVVPNGLEPVDVPTPSRVAQARRMLSWDDDEVVILWVGRFKKQKGVDTLLAAFAELCRRSRQRRLRLALVGTGPEEQRLREMAESLGISTAVEFAGYQRDTAAYSDACDLLALPSHMETFGNVLLEAMARAKPIVATRVGGIPEVVGHDAALLVPPQDESSLGEALYGLVNDLERRCTMGEAGRKRFLERFTLARMGDGVESVFRRVLARTSS